MVANHNTVKQQKYKPKWYCRKIAHSHDNDNQESQSSIQHIYVACSADSKQPYWRLLKIQHATDC